MNPPDGVRTRQRHPVTSAAERVRRQLRTLSVSRATRRRASWRRRGSRTRTALGGLDDRLASFIPVGTGYFVELGANDGIVQSNTYWLEVERGWSGLLIEPALNRYIELRRNRSDANAFACAACVPFGYQDEFVRMQYANLMTVSRSLPTDLADVDAHIATSTQFLTDGEETVTFGACARTLQSLLDDAQAPKRIDFLSLDVEGAELAVLGGVDHDRTRFDLALVESRDPESLERVLAGHDYGLVAQLSHHDYLFEDRRLNGPRLSD